MVSYISLTRGYHVCQYAGEIQIPLFEPPWFGTPFVAVDMFNRSNYDRIVAGSGSINAAGVPSQWRVQNFMGFQFASYHYTTGSSFSQIAQGIEFGNVYHAGRWIPATSNAKDYYTTFMPPVAGDFNLAPAQLNHPDFNSVIYGGPSPLSLIPFLFAMDSKAYLAFQVRMDAYGGSGGQQTFSMSDWFVDTAPAFRLNTGLEYDGLFFESLGGSIPDFTTSQNFTFYKRTGSSQWPMNGIRRLSLLGHDVVPPPSTYLNLFEFSPPYDLLNSYNPKTAQSSIKGHFIFYEAVPGLPFRFGVMLNKDCTRYWTFKLIAHCASAQNMLDNDGFRNLIADNFGFWYIMGVNTHPSVQNIWFNAGLSLHLDLSPWPYIAGINLPCYEWCKPYAVTGAPPLVWG